MKTSLVSVFALATLAGATSFWWVQRPSPRDPVAPVASAEGAKLLAHLPVAFVPNLGQWDHPAQFVARIGPMTVFLEQKGWTFTLVERTAEPSMGPGSFGLVAPEAGLGHEAKGDHASPRGVAVRMTFAGASAPDLAAEDQLPGRHHYFLGNDPAKWCRDVPLYRSVRYREIRPGIDVRAREQDGHFEYDLLLQPGAELEPVTIAVEGIERMHLDGAGALVLETRVGPVRMPAPFCWEEGPSGERSGITCRYRLLGNDRFGFEVSGRRPGWALVVDPGLVWSTFLGGSANDFSSALALDAQGAVTIAGTTTSSNFPVTPGAFDTSFSGLYNTFVTRLSPTGSNLVYSTYLGGSRYDLAYALALDAQGAATVAGSTDSTDFPTTPGAFATIHKGGARSDGFVTRLSPTGSSLVYSTFLGGNNDDAVGALALDTQGAVTLAGGTASTDFPTTPGALDTTHNGLSDAFVARLSPTGSSLAYSTFLGGTRIDRANAIALDSQGAATVAGNTYSPDFPTTAGAFDTIHNASSDTFVTRLSPTGSSLVYSTFLGGINDDFASGVALDSQGAATVVGSTFSADFPTTPGAFDTTHGGGDTDAFVTRLSPTGSSLVYSTFLGGALGDSIGAVVLDAQGAATVVGSTVSSDFPTTPGAFDRSFKGGTFGGDAFVTRVSPTGSSLVYSTFLAGTEIESGAAIALDEQGAATVAGSTSSPDFPTTPGAFDTSYNGGFNIYGDAFVARLDLLPTGVSAFGRSSPGCTGPLAISVTAMPSVATTTFAITCGNAPPNATGILGLAGKRHANPLIIFGVEVWIDFSRPFVPLPASSDNIGAAERRLPIPNDPALAGVQFFAQFFWPGPGSPVPCPPLAVSASHALDITIQP